MTKHTKIFFGAIGASILLFFVTPFFPFDELIALMIALIAGIMNLIEK